jgi:uncharacterized protein YndB with AHSA1/START domain
MKILFIILITIAGLVALLLVVGLFMKKEYHVVREVVINKPKQSVFEYIKLLKNQNKYSVWATMDANMKTEFKGTDGTPGFVSAWDSEEKNVGKGEQEILSIVEGEKIEYEIRFIRPFESTSTASMSTVAVGDNQTKVSWAFTGKMKYPMNLMLLFMNMEKMIGNDLDNGLKNLKGILEG